MTRLSTPREEWFAALGFAAVIAAPVLYIMFFGELPV